MSSPSPLRWRRRPLTVDNRPAKGQPPLRLMPPPLLVAGLATGSTATFCKRLPQQKALAAIGRPYKGAGYGLPPLQGVSPWLVALAKGLAMAGCPLSLLLRCENAARIGREENRRGRQKL
ncbi:hypothetical protein BHM03_00059075 [Ensete ventricosum]|nr:hypothetical protein BHM03_00059075 [Ensete ventricosum]